MNLGKIDCKSISYKIKSSEKSEDFFLFILKLHNVTLCIKLAFFFFLFLLIFIYMFVLNNINVFFIMTKEEKKARFIEKGKNE